jgi:hypothetical protein
VKQTVAVAGLALLPSFALATTPTMDAVAFPIDTASIVTAVVGAGAAILVLYFGVRVGFRMVKSLLSRTMKSV